MLLMLLVLYVLELSESKLAESLVTDLGGLGLREKRPMAGAVCVVRSFFPRGSGQVTGSGLVSPSVLILLLYRF